MFRISLDTHVFYEESNRNIHVRKYTFKIQFKKVLKASITIFGKGLWSSYRVR